MNDLGLMKKFIINFLIAIYGENVKTIPWIQKNLLRDYPCFCSSSVESCINIRKNGEVNLKELRDGKPCPYFNKCVELTARARKQEAEV